MSRSRYRRRRCAGSTGLDLGPKGFRRIRRLDDTLFLRWPNIHGHPEQGSSAAGGRRRLGERRPPGKLDGIERIFSFQRVSGYPFYAVSARRSHGAREYRGERGLYSERAASSTLLALWFGAVLLAKLKPRGERGERLSRSEAAASRSLTEARLRHCYMGAGRRASLVSVAGRPLTTGAGRGIGPSGPGTPTYVNMHETDWEAHRELLKARNSSRT